MPFKTNFKSLLSLIKYIIKQENSVCRDYLLSGSVPLCRVGNTLTVRIDLNHFKAQRTCRESKSFMTLPASSLTLQWNKAALPEVSRDLQKTLKLSKRKSTGESKIEDLLGQNVILVSNGTHTNVAENQNSWKLHISLKSLCAKSQLKTLHCYICDENLIPDHVTWVQAL